MMVGKNLAILLIMLSAAGLSQCRKPEAQSKSIIEVCELTTEYRVNPMGIDRIHPQLSWMIKSSEKGQKQTAYQIIVSSSSEKLGRNKGDLWDTGRIQDDQSNYIAYAGKPLHSQKQCFWKVRIWDKNEEVSPWSQEAFWTMGLLNPDDWKAQWISTKNETTASIFRKTVDLKTVPDQAFIYVASLGYFELYVNGKKVSQEVLTPAVSNFKERTYYNVYDLGPLLTRGINHLGIKMGRGWYAPGLPGVKHHSPVIRAQLEIQSEKGGQTILTDSSWECTDSERKLLGSWKWGDFGGELVNANLADDFWWNPQKSFDHWEKAIEITPDPVPCTAQTCEKNWVSRTFKAKRMEELGGDTYLFDFGTNLTGMMHIQFKNLQAGDTIHMYYADKDARESAFIGHPAMMYKGFSTMGQYDQFISAGKPLEEFENVFNYHAFRYVIIEGLPHAPDLRDLTAYAIGTGMQERGSFSCSNDLYNQIHQMVTWTYQCLNLGGQTVDCPHRERLGYGDGQTIMDLGLYNFQATSLYTKWSQNWWDEQTEDGFVPFTAPCPHSTGGGPAWGAMCIMVPWKTYLFSGDTRILKDGYFYMDRYLKYLDQYCEDELLQDIFPGEKWTNLGDWVPPRRGMEHQQWVDDKSRQFFNNCYRVYLLQIMQQVATVLNLKDDRENIEKKILVAQQNIHDKWYQAEDSTYVNGEQPYLIFPLKTGITPENLHQAVFEKYLSTLTVANEGHLNTGMIGTQIMTDYLNEIGSDDLVHLYVNKTSYPGWGYMVANGATTCWEQWNGNYSQIHSCFPYIGGWFYKGIAGIQWDTKEPGFKKIILRPGIAEPVDWAKCRFKSPFGWIESHWEKKKNSFNWKISIPPNSTALVYIPGREIQESGQSIQESSFCTFVQSEGKYNIFEIQSGDYNLSSIPD